MLQRNIGRQSRGGAYLLNQHILLMKGILVAVTSIAFQLIWRKRTRSAAAYAKFLTIIGNRLVADTVKPSRNAKRKAGSHMTAGSEQDRRRERWYRQVQTPLDFPTG